MFDNQAVKYYFIKPCFLYCYSSNLCFMKQKFKPKSVKEVNRLTGAERTRYFAQLIKYFRKQK